VKLTQEGKVIAALRALPQRPRFVRAVELAGLHAHGPASLPSPEEPRQLWLYRQSQVSKMLL
jgi:hypothetical protein